MDPMPSGVPFTGDAPASHPLRPLAGWYARRRRLIYPALVCIIYAIWAAYMSFSNSWGLFREYWPASLTMVLGSFVAGATAEGGGAVAFPVFTKVLHLAPTDARTFSLMIQSFGMGMASLFIITRKIRILPRVVAWVSLGGVLGHVLGTYWVQVPNPYPKVLFTFVTTAFGCALFLSTYIHKWKPLPSMPGWGPRYRLLFFALGILGGTFAAQVGSGIDVITFMVLTLAFGVDERVSTPTTVIIMAINSWVGFFLHGVISRDIGPMWNYWLVAVEVVIIGAPLGAFIVSKANRYFVINFILTLISLELVTTLWLVPIRNTPEVLATLSALAFCALAFWLMLRYRRRTNAEALMRPAP